MLLARPLGRAWPLAVAFAVPLGCELLQWAVPSMDRVGFQLSDLAANWTGVLVGALLGLLLLRVLPTAAASPPHPPLLSCNAVSSALPTPVQRRGSRADAALEGLSHAPDRASVG